MAGKPIVVQGGEEGESMPTMFDDYTVVSDKASDATVKAVGEIGREEFEQLRKDLEAPNTDEHGADSAGHSHGHCGYCGRTISRPNAPASGSSWESSPSCSWGRFSAGLGGVADGDTDG